jgi:hypothetical protein
MKSLQTEVLVILVSYTLKLLQTMWSTPTTPSPFHHVNDIVHVVKIPCCVSEPII